ncbi:ParB N-terminal domain-containing protein [Leptospira sp. FAT2]|uniref:helix-turn-helix domain-containing protein n=1 Tax=Leptospira sanjuanensis TaxID=2879643 RepID=UPI001EE7A9FD|nr:ParB N-terminal domain-containing protein [Leptospira sanjuanensis]MCG6195636.1 ParB N-terminal domain-containing protein [Leptospira sanjuanensis]
MFETNSSNVIESVTNQDEIKLERVKVLLEKIQFHPKNEKIFRPKTEEFIRRLAENIKRNGLHEPISLQKIPDSDLYLCLSGEHRIKAVKLLGWVAIDAYIVSPEDPVSYIAEKNYGKGQYHFKDRLLTYREFCPEFFTGTKIVLERLNEISKKTGILLSTLKGDLKKIRKGSNKEDSIEILHELWAKKKIRNLRINLADQGNGKFLLKVHGKNLNYEWRGAFKEVVCECAKAARSKYFDKNFKSENEETASRIKALRKEAGLTQFQLAQGLGYSQSYFAELEGGKWECSEALFEQIALFCQERIA